MIDDRFVEAPTPTWRLIPSQFPPISAFDTVATAADLEAVMELEGWTNDRLVLERVARLPRTEWVYGRPNSSIVMASFLHSPLGGCRFNGPHLGAWYGATQLRTAVAEVAHHLRREAVARGKPDERRTFRCYTAHLNGSQFLDIRGQQAERPEAYSRTSYAGSQAFGETLRASSASGIIYDSLRHVGGTNVVAFRPSQITDVMQADHYDILAPITGRIVARRLTTAA